MAADSNEVSLTLHIAQVHGEVDVNNLNQLTHTLMRNLEGMDVESVTLSQDQDYLPGKKGDSTAVDELLVSVLPTALPKVVEFLQRWVSQNKDHTIRVKIELGNKSVEIEYPATMSPSELKDHIEMMKQFVDETNLQERSLLSRASPVGEKSDLPLSSSNAVERTLPILPNERKQQRKRIFIVYSQKDIKHVQHLKIHLSRYEREKIIDVWSDSKITAGANRNEEIQKTLDLTKVAILLVSADFLASRFIAQNILPHLLYANEVGEIIILPVIIEHCILEDTPLQRFKPFNNLSDPLATKRVSERHKVWADLVRYVITLVKDV